MTMSQYPAFLLPFCLFATCVGGLLIGDQSAIGQVNPSSSGGTSVSSNSDTWSIETGQQHANSLFHRFDTFIVNEGQSAQFLVNPFSGVDRIVGYIENPSRIDGTIKIVNSTTPNQLVTADLFLLSPRGISLGPNAYLDIRGAFFATTADRLSFNDGIFFEDGQIGGSSVLNSHKPIEFSFGSNPGSVAVDIGAQPVTTTAKNLQIGAGLTALVLLGGDVAVQNRLLNVPVGGLYLGSVKSNKTVDLLQQSLPGNNIVLTYPSHLSHLGLIEIGQNSALISQDATIEIAARTIQLEPVDNDPSSNGTYVRSTSGDITVLGETIQAKKSQFLNENGDVTFTDGGTNRGDFTFKQVAIGPPFEQQGSANIRVLSRSIEFENTGFGSTDGDIELIGQDITGVNSSIFSKNGSIDLQGDNIDILQVGIANQTGPINFIGRTVSLTSTGVNNNAGDIRVQSETITTDRSGFSNTSGDINISSTNINLNLAGLTNNQGNINVIGEIVEIEMAGLANNVGRTYIAGSEIDVLNSLVNSEDGDIQLVGTTIDVSDSTLKSNQGDIDILGLDRFSLSNEALIEMQGNGSIAIQSNQISLRDESKINSIGAGDLQLSGGEMTLTSSSIYKQSYVLGETTNLQLNFQGDVSLQENSSISGAGYLNFTINADRFGFDETESTLSYVEPARFFSGNTRSLGLGFTCDTAGVCRYGAGSQSRLIPPLNLEPTAVLNSATSELSAIPVETISNPKMISAPISRRDDVSRDALNVRCQSPIARQVLFQRSGRGGLLSPPGASLTADVFQDFGGLMPRSTPPIASAPTLPTPMVLEAQNWQVDPQGRISLLAAVPVTGDRASQDCPNPLMQ